MNNHGASEITTRIYAPINSKLQHPLPGKARAFEDWIVQICASTGQNGTIAHKGHAANKNGAP